MTDDEQLAMALQMSLQSKSQDMETDGKIGEDPSANRESDDHFGGQEETGGSSLCYHVVQNIGRGKH